MSAIPETRTIDRQRRVNIPSGIAGRYDDGETFAADTDDGDIVLAPDNGDDTRTLSEKNRLRLPPSVVDEYDTDEEFAVLVRDGVVVLRPVANVDISL